jgi:NADH-quinone oxidoreductase subunit E
MISPERRRRAEDIIASFPVRSSAMIPLLHLWQDEEGYLSDEALAEVAEVMQVPAAEVQDVVSFYSMFHRRPLGRHHIEVCKSLSCALRGARRTLDHLQERLGVGLMEPTADGLVSVGAVECLAACDRAPAAQVNLHYLEEPLTVEAADRLIERLRAGDRAYADAGSGDGHA